MSSIVPEPSSNTTKNVQINDFSMEDDEGSSLYYRADEVHRPTGGSDEAAVLVQLDVDREAIIVTADLGSSGDLEVLERAAKAVLKTCERLGRMYPAGSRRIGRCMAQGDWGRCKLRDDHNELQAEAGHDPEHLFPTEEQWEADQVALGRIPKIA